MQTITRMWVGVAACIMLSTRIPANGPSYSDVQDGYLTYTGDADDGFCLGGSFLLIERFSLLG